MYFVLGDLLMGYWLLFDLLLWIVSVDYLYLVECDLFVLCDVLLDVVVMCVCYVGLVDVLCYLVGVYCEVFVQIVMQWCDDGVVVSG